MSKSSQLPDKKHSGEQLKIHFDRADDLNASISFNFLGQYFSSIVKLADARCFYKKLSESRFWSKDEDTRTLIAINPQVYQVCPRCGGTGDLPQFRHVQEGICFLCWGSGGRWGTEDSEGAIQDFSRACRSEQLGGLYEHLQNCMIQGFKDIHENEQRAKRDIEMEKIRERRRQRAEGTLPPPQRSYWQRKPLKASDIQKPLKASDILIHLKDPDRPK